MDRCYLHNVAFATDEGCDRCGDIYDLIMACVDAETEPLDAMPLRLRLFAMLRPAAFARTTIRLTKRNIRNRLAAALDFGTRPTDTERT